MTPSDWGLLYRSPPQGGGSTTRMTQPPINTIEEEEDEGPEKKQRRRNVPLQNINKQRNNCDYSTMSIVFVPKKLRGKAKINQETIQRVRYKIFNETAS